MMVAIVGLVCRDIIRCFNLQLFGVLVYQLIQVLSLLTDS